MSFFYKRNIKSTKNSKHFKCKWHATRTIRGIEAHLTMIHSINVRVNDAVDDMCDQDETTAASLNKHHKTTLQLTCSFVQHFDN